MKAEDYFVYMDLDHLAHNKDRSGPFFLRYEHPFLSILPLSVVVVILGQTTNFPVCRVSINNKLSPKNQHLYLIIRH